MQETVIIGVDVSKATLDFCILPSRSFLTTSNALEGFKKFFLELKRLSDPTSKVLVLLEHTGYYSFRFEKFLRQQQIGVCKIPAMQIKRSLGVTRGKTDKIDADRIAQYGWMRRDALTSDCELGRDIEQLRSLVNLRFKLVRDRSAYLCRVKEMIACGIYTKGSFEAKMQLQLIDSFSKQITKLENRIKALLLANEQLNKTLNLLKSIKGVGWIVAAYMIGCTDNFKKFCNARKFNCYAGLAPFRNESGSSIKGRSRVSHLANKQIKCLLNLAAFSAVRYDKELKKYYTSRVEAGKSKMACLNIIRSKLVGRMFAVIKRQSPYQERSIAA
jgi:transposase